MKIRAPVQSNRSQQENQVRQPSAIGKLPYLFLSYQKLFSNFISALIGKD